MNRSGFGERLLIRLVFGAIVLGGGYLVRTVGADLGGCSDAAKDKYIAAIDAITDRADAVFNKMNADNEVETLAAYAKLVDEASKIEHPSCLDTTHSEVMIVMQKRQEALKYAYDGETEKADQLMKEADEHFDKANAAIP